MPQWPALVFRSGNRHEGKHALSGSSRYQWPSLLTDSLGKANLMKHYIAAGLIAFSFVPAKAGTASLEKRVAALEQQVATLKEENKKLKESAVDFLSAELAQREKEHARLIYRTQILPSLKILAEDFGAKAPKLPKEDEVDTLADAYRPLIDMFTQLMTVATK